MAKGGDGRERREERERNREKIEERREVCCRGGPGKRCFILFCSCVLSSSLLPVCPRHIPLKSLPPSPLPQFPHLLPHGLGTQDGQGGRELETRSHGKGREGSLRNINHSTAERTSAPSLEGHSRAGNNLAATPSQGGTQG